MTGAQFNVYLRHFATYFSKITNPNPSPTGKKFGFVLFGTPEGTRTPNPRNRNPMLYPLSHRCICFFTARLL